MSSKKRFIIPLYGLARTSLVGSVHSIEYGRKLIARKGELKHGQWLPWLAANADVLGFDVRTTASRLMKQAANDTPAYHLDDTIAIITADRRLGHYAV